MWLSGVRAGCWLEKKERKKQEKKKGRQKRKNGKEKKNAGKKKKGKVEKKEISKKRGKKRRKVEKKEKAEEGGRSCRTRGCGREVLRVRSLWHLRDADPRQRSPGNRSRRFVGESVGLLRISFRML